VRVKTLEALGPVAPGTRVLYSISIFDSGSFLKRLPAEPPDWFIFRQLAFTEPCATWMRILRLENMRASKRSARWPQGRGRCSYCGRLRSMAQDAESRFPWRVVNFGWWATKQFRLAHSRRRSGAHCEAALLADVTGAYPVADEEPCRSREIADSARRCLVCRCRHRSSGGCS